MPMQEFTCPECGSKFNHNPDEGNIELLTESVEYFKIDKPLEEIEKEVTIYLPCPKGHVSPYPIKKKYKK